MLESILITIVFIKIQSIFLEQATGYKNGLFQTREANIMQSQYIITQYNMVGYKIKWLY